MIEVNRLMDGQNVECQKCNNIGDRWISLDCGHKFCLVCLLVMDSNNVLNEV